ncbi:hypothetical protein [Nostoc sphaeroides]|uniref:hypothetical protein n=1 Tax=Nostoc sphaeroides TaxID=446679 RepID=UPI001884397A|nr:hypothetical protein [Nostoc sphaeroides]
MTPSPQKNGRFSPAYDAVVKNDSILHENRNVRSPYLKIFGLLGAHCCVPLMATIFHNCQTLSILLKESILAQVSYLHYKSPVNLDLTNLLEATNGKGIRKILKNLHLLLSSVTVKAEAYNQTLT